MRTQLDHNKWEIKAIKEEGNIENERTFFENLRKNLSNYKTFVIEISLSE